MDSRPDKILTSAAVHMPFIIH